jgi:hypothetical protein
MSFALLNLRLWTDISGESVHIRSIVSLKWEVHPVQQVEVLVLSFHSRRLKHSSIYFPFMQLRLFKKSPGDSSDIQIAHFLTSKSDQKEYSYQLQRGK